jgi:hypothetical protein
MKRKMKRKKRRRKKRRRNEWGFFDLKNDTYVNVFSINK